MEIGLFQNAFEKIVQITYSYRLYFDLRIRELLFLYWNSLPSVEPIRTGENSCEAADSFSDR